MVDLIREVQTDIAKYPLIDDMINNYIQNNSAITIEKTPTTDQDGAWSENQTTKNGPNCREIYFSEDVLKTHRNVLNGMNI